jgi:formate-dependent nitrite reductase cytochrome c552 subunit
MERTKYGGSEALPHAPTQADPRRVIARRKLEADPRLVTMWAGYAFATGFRERRGHAYMLKDQRYTRGVTEFKQPGTCLNCHASTYVTRPAFIEGIRNYKASVGRAGFDVNWNKDFRWMTSWLTKTK